MTAEATAPGRLKRSVGFYGLMFVSLGSIIGSGWLLGALNAAQVVGPASIDHEGRGHGGSASSKSWGAERRVTYGLGRCGHRGRPGQNDVLLARRRDDHGRRGSAVDPARDAAGDFEQGGDGIVVRPH
jgi:hypothetical protein